MLELGELGGQGKEMKGRGSSIEVQCEYIKLVRCVHGGWERCGELLQFTFPGARSGLDVFVL